LIELKVNSGLCNRMRAIASALALSRVAGRPLTVYWFNTRALNCPFSRLFEPIPGVKVVAVETGRLRSLLDLGALRLRLAGWREPYDLFLSSDKMDELRAQGIDLAKAAAQAQRCGIETYGRFYGSAPFYDDLKPQRELLEEAEKTFSGIMAGSHGSVVGVHIRRGDNGASIQVSPLDLFLARMRHEVSEDPEVRFFLATDDPSTEFAVTSEFPGRVTVRCKDLSRNRARGVRDALVDLLVLSKCRLVLGSYWSSFSQTAAEISGAELEIVRTPV
jgi:hypothetical protein